MKEINVKRRFNTNPYIRLRNGVELVETAKKKLLVTTNNDCSISDYNNFIRICTKRNTPYKEHTNVGIILKELTIETGNAFETSTKVVTSYNIVECDMRFPDGSRGKVYYIKSPFVTRSGINILGDGALQLYTSLNGIKMTDKVVFDINDMLSDACLMFDYTVEIGAGLLHVDHTNHFINKHTTGSSKVKFDANKLIERFGSEWKAMEPFLRIIYNSILISKDYLNPLEMVVDLAKIPMEHLEIPLDVNIEDLEILIKNMIDKIDSTVVEETPKRQVNSNDFFRFFNLKHF